MAAEERYKSDVGRGDTAVRGRLNTLAFNINRRLAWCDTTELFPHALVGAVGLWPHRKQVGLSAVLISFATFALTLTLWYRAALRAGVCRHARRIFTPLTV